MGTKYTPGPWTINRYTNYCGWSVYSEPDGCLAERWYTVERTEEQLARMYANAALIAAAPELAEAARLTLNLLDTLTPQQFERGEDKPAREALRAALKKAGIA